MVRSARRTCRAAALALAATLLSAAPAAALGLGDDWGMAWSQTWSDVPMSPGSVRGAELVVSNDRAEEIGMALGVVDLVDDEGGCLRQEQHSPLEDCGPSAGAGTGELSDQLQVVAAVGDQVVYDGTLAGLVDLRSDVVAVPSGGEVRVGLRLTLPDSSTNETMTDRVGFALQAYAAGPEGEVLGVSLDAGGVGAGGGTDGAGSQGGVLGTSDGLLPSTGATVGLRAWAGAVVLSLGGFVLWRAGRGRARREPGGPGPGA